MRRPALLPKISFLLRFCICFMGDDFSFLLHPMEKREGENGDGCCAPDGSKVHLSGNINFRDGYIKKPFTMRPDDRGKIEHKKCMV